MRDYSIDLHAIVGARATTVATQACGTISDRPLLCKTYRDLPPAAAAYTGLIAALDDLEGFLGDADHIAVTLTARGGDASLWIARGSGDPALDARLRARIMTLHAKGVSCALAPGETPDATLAAKAELAQSLGM